LDCLGEGDGGVGGVVSGRGEGGGASVWEKLHCLVDSLVASGGDVESMAAVVVQGGSDVPCINTVGFEGASLCRFVVGEDTATGWS
jgi:hypothetical protein